MFRQLARIHAMDVPLKRQHWICKDLTNQIEDTIKRFPNLNELIRENNCNTLMANDVQLEVQWLNQTIAELNSPMVFSHNDVVHTNIMILDTPNNNGYQVMLCDYENAGYSYRGHDLGSIVCDWGHPWTDVKAVHNFIDDSLIEKFLNFYINENVKIFGEKYKKNANNSLKQLMKETKVFALVFKIMQVLWYIKMDGDLDDFPLDKMIAMVCIFSNLYFF